MSYTVKLKRIHDEPEADDGARILVDPMLPKDKNEGSLGLDEWYSKAAPSISLRSALRKGDLNFDEFLRNYMSELDQNPAVLAPLVNHAREQGLTLLTYTQPLDRSFLPTLREMILRALHEEDMEISSSERSPSSNYDH